MRSKSIKLGFILSLIGIILIFYLCFNFLTLTLAGYFNFLTFWEQFGMFITIIMILLCGALLTFCILGFAIQKFARVFGVILLNIAALMYGMTMFFTFYSVSLNMPVELWPTLVIGSDGLCLILIGGISYIIFKNEG